MGEEKEGQEPKEPPREFEWMIRPCMMYKAEYDDCISIRARFHQYFVFGNTIDCTQWDRDYHNCYQWEKYRSDEAYDELMKSERRRRMERLRPHYQNDVWERREKPPENWNDPLPDWMQAKFKNSYLQLRNEEMKKGVGGSVLDSKCTIL